MLKVNGIKIEPTMFSDKTSQIWKLPLEKMFKGQPIIDIVWDFEHEGEIFQLMQLDSLLRVENYSSSEVFSQLTMNYLPYARQDKDISNDTTFALTTFARIINDMYFSKVIVLDAHSGVASDLINNLEDGFPSKEISKAYKDSYSTIMAFPDAGACTRYVKGGLRKSGTVIGHKVRDQKNGLITDYKLEISEDINIRGHHVLMCDDICDGGMTFILMAKALYEAGAAKVSLYVTHGIFSKGVGVLEQANIVEVYDRKGLVYDEISRREEWTL